MQVAKWAAVAAAALVMLAAGCRINAPVYNVADAPVMEVIRPTDLQASITVSR